MAVGLLNLTDRVDLTRCAENDTIDSLAPSIELIVGDFLNVTTKDIVSAYQYAGNFMQYLPSYVSKDYQPYPCRPVWQDLCSFDKWAELLLGPIHKLELHHTVDTKMDTLKTLIA